jgi:hypothetical protein
MPTLGQQFNYCLNAWSRNIYDQRPPTTNTAQRRTNPTSTHNYALYALRILSETGVRVDSPSVVEMLKKTGQAEDQPEARQVLREKTRDIMANLSVPEDYEELIRRGTTFIKQIY